MEGRTPDQDGIAVSRCPIMARARFSIGIDLGTTNCALAFVSLDDEARSKIFDVPQWDTLSAIAESPALPSFLYLPDDAAAAQTGKAGNEEWIVGRFARKNAAESPGRVAHSAKSWLCHHTSDRSARSLPWGSDEIARNSKISPVRASALILNHLKRAWNTRFADAGTDFEFNRQAITVTVPASFDAAAQRLTLTAALEAGFPETIHLLEEPQAAFYCWVEQHDIATDLEGKLPNDPTETYHVLVVDIGGGTSDFSLLEFRSDRHRAAPKIKRQAVGDHILLGGDNVDLAIAHFLEPRLTGERGKLSGTQWDDLVARCRDLKEKMLSSEGEPDERFAVSLPGRGSGLVASSHTARLTRPELWALLLDGFFPECDSRARPYRTQAALKEWGLPYASDCARGTLPISCGAVRVSTRYCSTAARCVLSSCATGSVSCSGNGRGACRRSRWKTRIPTSLLRAAQRYLEKVSVARWNALRRVPRAGFFSKCFESSRASLPNRLGARLCVFSRVAPRPSNGSTSQDSRSRCTPIILPASRPITPLAT